VDEYRPPRPTYTKWLWKDLIAKTQAMGTTAFGAYVRIMGYMVTVSHDYCSAPDDDRVLSRVAGVSLKVWRRVRPEVVAQLDLTTPGRVISRRLCEDAQLWAMRCSLQRMRRTGGQPTVNPRYTAGPPDEDHTRAREKPEARKNLRPDSSLASGSGNGLANPTPIGVQGPVAIAPGKPIGRTDETWAGWKR
jgi:uncharacterized protein YdaU (DUF1376 family)